MSNYYRHFNGMCWPVPSSDMAELAWRAVHSTPSKTDLLVMASVITAYHELVTLPATKRNSIISELRKGMNNDNTN